MIQLKEDIKTENSNDSDYNICVTDLFKQIEQNVENYYKAIFSVQIARVKFYESMFGVCYSQQKLFFNLFSKNMLNKDYKK